MKKKIVTLHPVYACEPGFFNRDFGQIGYTFMKEKGYNSEIWSLKQKSQKNFEIKGQKWKGFSNSIRLYIQLVKNAKKINILHMYHIWRFSFIGAIIYKILNKNGKIIIKLDNSFSNKGVSLEKKLNKVPLFLIKLFFKKIDYLLIEDERILKFLIKRFTEFKNKFLLVTNGAFKIKSFIGNINKINKICLCGRFGAQEKNYELLLDVLYEYDISFLKEWKISFIGNYTKEFSKKINNLIVKKPELKGKLILKGFMNEKNDIYEELANSKIFLHTSNQEGDPNIQYDSMFTGNFIVTTEVGNIKQNYPSEYALFYKINDKKDLYNTLIKGIEKTNKMNKIDYNTIQKYCLKKFIWEERLKIVFKRL